MSHDSHDDVVKRLLGAQWRLYKTIDVPDSEGTAVTLEIRCPPQGIAEKLLTEAKELRAKHKDEEEGSEALAWSRKVIALTVWLPGGVRGCFTPEQVGEWPYAATVLQDCMSALNPAAGIEAAKKN